MSARAQVLDERSEVRHVVVNAALSFRSLAGAVAAAVERHDPERLRQFRHDEPPGLVRAPRAVHEDEGYLARPADLVEEPNAVDVRSRHVTPRR